MRGNWIITGEKKEKNGMKYLVFTVPASPFFWGAKTFPSVPF